MKKAILYNSYKHGEIVIKNMESNAEKACSNGGVTPLGYKIADRKYIIDKKNAPIVKEIFKKYADGMRIKDICDSLNKRGIKTSKGAAFNKSSLNTMLRNRKYLGIYMYNGIEVKGGMPQIIDEALFNTVTEKMWENRRLLARARARAEYLLTSKLFCGHCKEAMVGHSSNKITTNGVIYNYYKCKNTIGKNKSCHKRLAVKEYIETLVIEECRKKLTPDTENQLSHLIKQSPDSDINLTIYNRALIKLIADKIFLYDDRFTITFNPDSEDVTIFMNRDN